MTYTNHLFQNSRMIFFIALVVLLTTGTSCKKYLEKKPNQSIVVPANLNDLQAVLDDHQSINLSPSFLELVADNYYVSTTSWNSVQNEQRLNYIWDRDARIIFTDYVWKRPYEIIYNANFVLDLLPEITFDPSEQITYNNIKGSALFHRAFQFYQLAQLFCRPYSTSAATDLGIILKLTSIVTDPYTRSTVQQTYDRIIADLKEAADLLPVTALFTTRPNKGAAYGALARAFLSMRDYVNAGIYADKALALNNTLLNYNTLSPGNPLPNNFLSNPEVLFVSTANVDLLNPPRPIVDSNLYQTYNGNDLRKAIFFGDYGGGKYYWKGSYFSTAAYFGIFSGLVTDEIYLIRAECRARAGNKDDAMSDLNYLLRNRYDSSFTDLAATDAADALTKILIERRKELLFRGVRWTDLRRFNLENANITLTRIIDGVTYTLPPNDLRWVLLIPDIEISRSGIAQNLR